MVHTEQYITHRFPLDQIHEAFHAAESRKIESGGEPLKMDTMKALVLLKK